MQRSYSIKRCSICSTPAPAHCIVHTSSSVGRVGRAYWGAYAASVALEGLSQVLADETEVAGRIKVFSVNPGGTRTKMRKEAYPLEDPEHPANPGGTYGAVSAAPATPSGDR